VSGKTKTYWFRIALLGIFCGVFIPAQGNEPTKGAPRGTIVASFPAPEMALDGGKYSTISRSGSVIAEEVSCSQKTHLQQNRWFTGCWVAVKEIGIASCQYPP
jgi:hypothetical protein